MPKLYALLPVTSQQLVSRLGVSEMPIPLEALAKLIDTDDAAAAEAIDRAGAYGLAQKFSEKDKPDLYHVPGLIRIWLTAPERVTSETALATHGKLAQFWRSAFENERHDELSVSPLGEVFSCHYHARIAGDLDNWNCCAGILSRFFFRISDWKRARFFLEAIPEALRESSIWHELASIDIHGGTMLPPGKN